MKKKKALRFFKVAKEYMEKNHPSELKGVRNIPPFELISSECFLGEYCWVVYVSGFKVSVVSSKFSWLRKAFKDFDIERISRMRSVKQALEVFNNERKAKCFLKGTKLIHDEGFDAFKNKVERGGMEELESLPGIGPITKKHLARNVGLADVSKDDIFIERLVKIFNARDEDELATYLACMSGEKKGTVDLILWRFCADKYAGRGVDGLKRYVDTL